MTSGTAWVYDDGGSAAAGFRGSKVGDCICRAIAIATEKPYREVHDELTAIGWNYRHTYWRDADGLFVPGEEAQRRERAYIASLGLQWHPTMRIGSGCKVHLRADELPSGRIIARVTRHFGHLIVLRTDGPPRFAHAFASTPAARRSMNWNPAPSPHAAAVR